MNKNTQIALITIAILAGGFLLIWSLLAVQGNREKAKTEFPNGNGEEINGNEEVNGNNEEMTRQEREERVERLIRENISALSPVPEVLGGTFMVTDMRFTGENSGVVEYEDGHIALIADFSYTIDVDGTTHITLSDVREATP